MLNLRAITQAYFTARSHRVRGAFAGVLSASIGLSAALFVPAAMAQQEMSTEELQVYIAEKQAELAKAIEQRDRNAEKRAEIAELKAQQMARQETLEQELRNLCAESDQTEPGSLADCLSQFNLEP